ncbi:GGDEF domain-containing protein [Thermaurantiacus sp.]
MAWPRLVPWLMAAAASIAALDLERRRRALARAALTDPLTGLPNRRGLEVAWTAARGARREGLLFLDLVGFKAVNDRLGHHVGDQLLKAVAQRLSRALPRDAVLTRHGGDEFVVLGAPEAGQALAAALEAPFPVEGAEPVRIGVRIARARVAGDLEAALADAARQLKPPA